MLVGSSGFLNAMAHESTNHPFISQIEVRFGDCDPAGIMFFPRIFEFAHSVFEEFIEHTQIGWSQWFRKGPFIVPLRHVNSDFFRPFLPGRKYQVHSYVSKLGSSSFEMTYEFFGTASGQAGDANFQGELPLHARVQMVHVFADSTTKTKIEIPEDLRKKLSVFLKETSR